MGTLSRFYTGPIINEIIFRKPELYGLSSYAFVLFFLIGWCLYYPVLKTDHRFLTS